MASVRAPVRLEDAPVKAPDTCPNRWSAYSVSPSSPLLRCTRGPLALDAAWSFLAKVVLPTPTGPRKRTGRLNRAYKRHKSYPNCIATDRSWSRRDGSPVPVLSGSPALPCMLVLA